MEPKINICRLCLQIVNNDSYVVLENLTRDMLKALINDLDLAISKTPVVCKECAGNIKTFFDFKLKHPNFVMHDKPFRYVEEDMTEAGNKQNICQWCMEITAESDLINIGIRCINEDAITAEVIQKYLTELESKSLLALCSSCSSSLHVILDFLKICRNTEKVIQKYCNENSGASNGKVNMCDILQFKFQIKDEKAAIEEPEIDIKPECITKLEDDTKKSTKSTIGPGRPNLTRTQMQSKMNELAKLVITLRDTKKMDVSTHRCEYYSQYCKDTSEIEIYKCACCLFETQYKSRLVEHSMNHPLIFKCARCNFSSSCKIHYRQHQVSNGKKGYRKKCKWFHNETCEQHSVKFLQGTRSLTYKCDLCAYQSCRRCCLTRHTLTHTNTAHRCEICADQLKRNISGKWQMLLKKPSGD